MKRVLCLALASFVFLVAARAGKASRRVEGDVAAKRAEALTTEISWKSSLDDALADAKAQGKLVFWMQMLGYLDGTT